MKIVIATPLYPPDIEPLALYVKELARRLSAEHEITVLTYGDIPEEIPGVTIIAVSKSQPMVTRVAAFTRRFLSLARNADIVIAENGSSVELPLVIVQLFTNVRTVLHIGDKKAAEWVRAQPLRKLLFTFVRNRSRVIEHQPDVKPEILPFFPNPTEALAAYEASWDRHLATLHTTYA